MKPRTSVFFYQYFRKKISYFRTIIWEIINIFQNATLNLKDKNKLLSFISLDKKNVCDKLNYIILKKIGRADIINNMSLTTIKNALTIL